MHSVGQLQQKRITRSVWQVTGWETQLCPGHSEMPCCHVSMSLPTPVSPCRELWAEMEVEMEKWWACSNMACCTPPWKLLWKGAGCSQGSSLVYDPFCFLQQSGSHYTYATGKVEVGFGGVLVVCFDFFGGFLGFFGGYFRLFGFCGGWGFFYLEGFLLVWGGDLWF